MTRLSARLRRKVAERARYRCEYCHSQQRVTGSIQHIDHIQPESVGGATEIDNLVLSCARCNLYKGNRTHFRDPVSGRSVPLYHPRRQNWTRHFSWSEDGTRIIGQTQVGRATVIALKMNHTTIVLARRIWVDLGVHPPQDY